ncbi:MAG: hypothetical protein ABI443_02350 [Chthoniobacterales bacterium]
MAEFNGKDRGMNEATPSENSGGPSAIAGLFFGVFGMFLWLMLPLGLPTSLLGLFFSIRALKGVRKTMARIATILCSLGLILTVANFGLGYYVMRTGKPRVLKEAIDKLQWQMKEARLSAATPPAHLKAQNLYLISESTRGESQVGEVLLSRGDEVLLLHGSGEDVFIQTSDGRHAKIKRSLLR